MSPLSPPTPILNRVKRKKILFHTHQQESEAATTDVLKVKVFLEILQNSQKNTCARVLNFAKFLRHLFYRKPLGDCFLRLTYHVDALSLTFEACAGPQRTATMEIFATRLNVAKYCIPNLLKKIDSIADVFL